MTRPKRWPIAVRTVELRAPLHPLADVTDYPRTRVFVLDGGAPIGSVDIRNARGPISVTTLRDAITNSLAYPLMQRALAAQLAPPGAAALDSQVPVSIVIATCNRPDDLRRCLMALHAQVSPRHVEVVVVDNRPGGASTPQAVRDFPNVILIEEARPGLSYARNAGFRAATGDILIAIDDDVTVPAGWLERLVAAFARPEVMAVTGNVLPIELETEAQCWFEAYGGLGKGFNRFEVAGDWFLWHRGAVPTWQLGATANAAFRAAIFQSPDIGLLDEALGPGMPSGCGEDTYLFYKILKAGHTIVYEPAAWVWHRHRRDHESLRHQIYCYSKGHVAYQLTTWLRDGDRRAFVRLGYSLPKVYGWRARSRVRGHSDYPLNLIFTEITGNLAGPWGLWQSRRRVRRFGRSAPVRRHAVSMEGPLTQSPAP
jgi:GT2 family glycosyltransferase